MCIMGVCVCVCMPGLVYVCANSSMCTGVCVHVKVQVYVYVGVFECIHPPSTLSAATVC